MINNVDSSEKLPSVLSFCSGYAGIERGFELAGFEHRAIAYVEIESFAIANLVSKMEEGRLVPAPIWSNLKTFPAQIFRDKVDVLTAGYPCQPFSQAGKREGENDPRHLWPVIREHIAAIRPVRCFFENVEGHISLGLRDVLEDLARLGYSTMWGLFSASEVSVSESYPKGVHQRKRIFILAYTDNGFSNRSELQICTRGDAVSVSSKVSNTVSPRSETRLSRSERSNEEGNSGITNDCGSESSGWEKTMHWSSEPNVGRVVDGCADRVDRIRLLGNGVVPQTAAKAWSVLNGRVLDSDE